MSLTNQMPHMIVQIQFQLFLFLHDCLMLVCSCSLYNISIKILSKVIDLPSSFKRRLLLLLMTLTHYHL